MAGNKGIMSLLVIVVLATVSGICSAKSVVVGGNTGWTLPPSASFYSNWASQQNLLVGDVLVFNFPAGAHTVAEVSKANYDSCTTATTVGPVITTPPANITLTTSGSHYFVCTIPGHCGLNQKLTVSVTAAASAPTPSASPSPKKSPAPISSPVAAPTPSVSTTPISPVAMGPSASSFQMGPAAVGGPASGAGSAPPPAGNFAAATGVSILSLLSAIVALAVLF
ncbi:blue copper protein-like [Silene latifolia]|uniref:blue copper protein-like n=1 Tax=Silene latifolia TaxID=37657 RepID=UPI003D78AE0A